MWTIRGSLLLQIGAAAGGVLCALAAIQIVQRFPFPSPEPAAPAGYFVDRYGPTSVYAPTPAAARRGQQEVQYARTRFHALFGIHAPALTVVLVEDPQHLRAIDLQRLRPRGGRLLPFLTPAALAASPGTGSQGDAQGGEGDQKLLAHEACHGYVAALADGMARRPRAGGAYGHHALPDWFEEAVAVLCESEEGRAARRLYFRDRLDERIPVATFTSMVHPLSGVEIVQKLGIDTTTRQGWIEVLTAERIHAAQPELDPMMFYAQALSLGEFIEQRISAGDMSILARSLVEGADLADALRQVEREVPALPPTVDSLEAEWFRWVLEDVRE